MSAELHPKERCPPVHSPEWLHGISRQDIRFVKAVPWFSLSLTKIIFQDLTPNPLLRAPPPCRLTPLGLQAQYSFRKTRSNSEKTEEIHDLHFSHI